MVPIPILSPNGLPLFRVRTNQTEQLLDQTLSAVRLIAEVLVEKFGESSLPPNLRHLARIQLPEQIETLVRLIDEHMAGGREPSATRLVHDEMNLTWDQAIAFTGHWATFTHDDRNRVIRMALFSRALCETNESTT